MIDLKGFDSAGVPAEEIIGHYGQTMTQVRGKTAAASQWQNYNRKFKRCN